jgi:DNA-binding NtrC family response regulator
MESTLSPRVLIVMPEQWPRALLRAALREVGYDAVGTRNLDTALRVRPQEPDRGTIRLVIVDQSAASGSHEQLAKLLSLHGTPLTILLARPTLAVPAGQWQRVIKRPASIDEIVSAVRESMPLPSELRHPID